MSNLEITSFEYFENGIAHAGEVVGSLGNGYPKYVARYGFTAGERGASAVSLAFASSTVSGIPQIPENGDLVAIVTMDANAYTNHCADDITDALAKSTLTKGAQFGYSLGYSCTIEYNFLPNTDYYIFVVPKTISVGVVYAHRNYTGCTASGSAVFAVRLDAGVGVNSVTGAGNYVIGETVAIGANLEAGYSFIGWTGYVESGDIQFSFTMPAQDVSLMAIAAVLQYVLSISPGVGSEIIVERKSSVLQGADAGFLNDGDVIYHSDVLQIDFSASEGRFISAHTVNGSAFHPGNVHTVTDNVIVAAVADILAYPIGNGDSNDLYHVYIGDGAGGGDYYVAYIGTDNGPTLYGSAT